MSILFLEDWKKYPRAIADLNTTNTSWVTLAKKYKLMGIKNHMFLLALHDPDLQGVDPFDPNLDAVTIGKITAEARINHWYFFREIARVPPQSGAPARPLMANRGNICLYWCFFNHILVMLIQVRQTGKSISTFNLLSYLLNVGCNSTQMNMITKDDQLRRAGVELLKEIMDELPWYLKRRDRTDTNNGEEITVNQLGNKLKTHVPATSEKTAGNKGRGLTSPVIYGDELPFQKYIGTALKALLPVTGAAFDTAKSVGAHHGIVFTTTAGRKDSEEGAFVYNLLMEMAIWSEAYFDAQNLDELVELLKKTAPGKEPRINATFSHRQLGYTDEWLRTKVRMSLSTGEDADRDYFNRWTSGNSDSPFSVDTLEKISASSRAADYTEICRPNLYAIRWYIPEQEIATRMATGHFIAGIDTSDSVGKDESTLVVVDVSTLEVICAANINETNNITFSRWLFNFLMKYVNVTAIIERKSSGMSIIDSIALMMISEGVNPFKRLFNMVVHSGDEDPERLRAAMQPPSRWDDQFYERHKRLFGYNTSGSGETSRDALYVNTLSRLVNLAATNVIDQRLVSQIASLVVKNGRLDHKASGNDDMVIGWLLAGWLILNSKGLGNYGIDTTQMLSRVGLRSLEDFDPVEDFKKQQQRQIRAEIEEIYERYTREEDEYVSQRLEQELRRLTSAVVLEHGEVFNISGLIEQARSHKRDRLLKKKDTSDARLSNHASSVMPAHGYYGHAPGHSPNMARNPYRPY